MKLKYKIYYDHSFFPKFRNETDESMSISVDFIMLVGWEYMYIPKTFNRNQKFVSL